MNNELLSVIVPVYNVEKYLEECIDSIVKQTYKNIEIIIVNDGSTDGSGELCDKISKHYKNVYVVHKRNEGLGYARNTGMENAHGKYVMFVDSDDYLEQSICEILMNKMINDHLDYCKCGYQIIDDEKKILGEKCYDFEAFDDSHYMMSRMIGSLPDKKDVIEPSAWGGIYDLSIIKKNNILFPSERVLISEDIVFNIDYFEFVKKAEIIEYCGYNYRFNPKSLSKSYKADRFEKVLILYEYLNNKLLELNYLDDSFTRLKTLFFVKLKVIISQEKFSKKNDKDIRKQINMMVNNDITRSIINSYPIKKQKFKQKIFINLIKNRNINIILLLLKVGII